VLGDRDGILIVGQVLNLLHLLISLIIDYMTDVIKKFKDESAVIMGHLKQEMAGIRANRPNAGLVENIMVSCYDQNMPLKQISSISVVPPREIYIQVWDKSVVSSIIKAIESSALGLSGNADGNAVRIHLPELSAERREELMKYAKKRAEEFRIRLRQARDEANKEIQKMFGDGEIQEDAKFKLKEDIQKETDGINKEIDEILKTKMEEINM